MKYLNKFTESLNDSTEKNYLIAEFMGMKPHDVEELDGFWTNTIKAHKYDSVANLQFDTDWNWLMQVVDKIDSLGDINTRVEISNYTFIDASPQIIKRKGTKMENTYDAVVDFIKWYNKLEK